MNITENHNVHLVLKVNKTILQLKHQLENKKRTVLPMKEELPF